MAIKRSWTEKTIVLRLTFPLLTGQSLTMASLLFYWMPLSNVIVEPPLLRELAGSIYSLITRGVPLSWSADPEHECLVQYGVARFIDTNEGDIRVEEPLALIGILRHLEEMSHTIERDIKAHFQVNRGLWF